MRVLLGLRAAIVAHSLSLAVYASAQQVMPGDVAPSTVAPPNRSGLTPFGTLQTDENLRASIMRDCDVAAWQVSIATEVGGQTRLQMSPTLSLDKKKCVTFAASAAR